MNIFQSRLKWVEAIVAVMSLLVLGLTSVWSFTDGFSAIRSSLFEQIDEAKSLSDPSLAQVGVSSFQSEQSGISSVIDPPPLALNLENEDSSDAPVAARSQNALDVADWTCDAENGVCTPPSSLAVVDEGNASLIRTHLESTSPSLSIDSTTALPTNALTKGDEQAAITVVEYSDFQCPFCASVASFVNYLDVSFQGKVKFIFKNNPLSIHPDAPLAHEAAMAAAEQGKFWEMHDLLFENQEALKKADLVGYAEELNLDMDSFMDALDTRKFRALVERDRNEARSLGVRGTPTFIVNGQRLEGAISLVDFSAAIGTEMASYQKALDAQLEIDAYLETEEGMNPGAASAQAAPLAIDFDRITNVPDDVRGSIATALAVYRPLIATETESVTISSFRDVKDWAHIVMVPTRVVDAGWQVELKSEEVIDIIARFKDGQWTSYLMNSVAFQTVKKDVPTNLLDLSGPPPSNEPLNHGRLFPWRSGATWRVGSLGWHQGGNAIDFNPTGNDDDVLAIDDGVIDTLCNDGWQVQLRVTTPTTWSWYLHIDANTIDPNIMGQTIPRGWRLGDLYDGNVINFPNLGCAFSANHQFNTPCGCGTGPHVHFTVPNTSGNIDGNTILSVGNNPGGTYVSTNTMRTPCGPPGAGTWTISSSCWFSGFRTAPGNVVIQNNAKLTMYPNSRINIDFVGGRTLLVRDGSWVWVINTARID